MILRASGCENLRSRISTPRLSSWQRLKTRVSSSVMPNSRSRRFALIRSPPARPRSLIGNASLSLAALEGFSPIVSRSRSYKSWQASGFPSRSCATRFITISPYLLIDAYIDAQRVAAAPRVQTSQFRRTFTFSEYSIAKRMYHPHNICVNNKFSGPQTTKRAAAPPLALSSDSLSAALVSASFISSVRGLW